MSFDDTYRTYLDRILCSYHQSIAINHVEHSHLKEEFLMDAILIDAVLGYL